MGMALSGHSSSLNDLNRRFANPSADQSEDANNNKIDGYDII
jgi:hypothetical protein